MLLKIGAVVMAAALAVAAGVALVVSLRAPGEPVEASPAAKTASAEAASGLDSYERFEEKPRETVPRSETKEPESKAKEPEEKSKPPKRQPGPSPESRRASLPAETPNGPVPRPGELDDTDLQFAPEPGADANRTFLGCLRRANLRPDSAQALEAGVGHVSGTSMPWDAGEQRNVYLAAHRLGYPGIGSRLLFYELDKLRHGDAVIIKGRGETYRYRVTYSRVVSPSDSWVMGKVRGRDMVKLQTCTPIPTFEKRLIMRADRVG